MTIFAPRTVIDDLQGVGRVELELDEGRSLYLFVGGNGVGKTKTLEALFQAALAKSVSFHLVKPTAHPEDFVFQAVTLPTHVVSIPEGRFDTLKPLSPSGTSERAVVFLGSQGRGFISPKGGSHDPLGTEEDRYLRYARRQVAGMADDFTRLNMDTDVNRWFVQRAQSANPHQTRADDRRSEIASVLRVLHLIDSRIDPDFLEVSGAEIVSLRIDDEARELPAMSTGFSAILKIVQAIVEGFSSFTNASEVENVAGSVFIDEIESHLHAGWQVKVMRMLRSAFPSATFYVTSHSPLVSSQCADGEVYELMRTGNGTVRSRRVLHPGKSAFVDLMRDVFGVDANRLKLDRMALDDQAWAKGQLRELAGEARRSR